MPIVRIDGKVVSARRAVYGLFERPLYPFEKLTPSCGSPICVNPRHMVIGTIGEKPAVPEPDDLVVDETPMSPEELADIILEAGTRDAEKLSELLGVPLADVHVALATL